MRDTIKQHYPATLVFAWAVLLTFIAAFGDDKATDIALIAALHTGFAAIVYLFVKQFS